MIPLRLELHNFLAYKDPDPLNLEGVHIACISGENGAGKSSLLDAITWALWGKARSSSPDDLIYQREREMRVVFEFELAGQRYRVIRQRRAEGKVGTSLLELQALDASSGDWRSLSEHTLRQTQDRLTSLLRLDYDTFVNSAYLAQGRADEFTAKPPVQRIQILATILGLDRWQEFEERAKDRLRATKEAAARIDLRLEEIRRAVERRAEYQGELNAAQHEAEAQASHLASLEQAWAAVEQVQLMRANIEKQQAELRARLTADRHEVQEALREAEALRMKADRHAMENRGNELERQRNEAQAARKLWEEANEKSKQLGELAGTLRGENAGLAPETEPIKARIQTLEAAREPQCPTCGQPLDEKHRGAIVRELHAEVEARRERFKANKARLQEVTNALGALQTEMAALRRQMDGLPALERRIAEMEAAARAAQEAAEKLPAAEARVAKWQKAVAEAEALQQTRERESGDLARRLAEAEQLRRTLEQARLAKRMADERVGGARQRLAALDALEAQSRTLEAEAHAQRDEMVLLEELREAFGRRGVPNMIIETVVPEVEEVANALLAKMTEGQMMLRLETQRETKGGETRETLEIIISDGLGTRAYEMYSGGEAFRINFALRVALSKLLARRAGAQLRALFIDEGFGSQDALGRERLVAAINSIQVDFDRILVVTHLDELRDAFPARIEVTKTPEGSQLRLV
ncbi:MAG: SMC family ATPase [Chloroflexi bacterium]|nr:SMC family ATPase [Chloroflexota bacterium]